MKKKYLTILSILIITIISACGGNAGPTMSAEDIANTAMADAWISITQTQAAMPTATVVPPTSTLAPILTLPPTLPPLATLAPAGTPVSAGPTADVCNQAPDFEPKGTLVNVEFKNVSEGVANFAFGMNTPNDQKECVTYTFTLGSGKGSVTPAKVLVGCYWGYAWITGTEPSVARTGGEILCLSDANLTYHILITKETINFE